MHRSNPFRRAARAHRGAHGPGERLLVVLLDAFGMRFVERHDDHPLLRRLDTIRPLEAQFPTTTTAEMTTLHTGLPVGCTASTSGTSTSRRSTV